MSASQTQRRVVITGAGVAVPGGVQAAALFDRLLAGESLIRLFRHPHVGAALTVPAVHCKDFDVLTALDKVAASTMDRFSQLGTAAALEAWRDAGLDVQSAGGRPDYGVAWGTGVGGTMTFEQGYRDIMLNGKERVPPLSVVLAMNNACASHIAIRLGLGGTCTTFSVACASSAVAVGDAFQRIRSGQDEVVVAGGSEAPLSEAVMRAWDAMRVLAPGDEGTAPAACMPFHTRRQGLVLGEGGAALVLESYQHARARGARIYAEVTGYGTSCDHVHLVKPDTSGQVRALRATLAQAGLAAEAIGYVNAHGTATREGDPAEIAAIREVFAAHAQRIAVSATKSAHGHLLGATGAMEALITALSVYRSVVPPTLNLDEVSEDCAGVDHVRGAARELRGLRAAISNSFAFGGSNAVLAFEAV